MTASAMVFDEGGVPSGELSSALWCPGCHSARLEWKPGCGATCGDCGAGFPWKDGTWYCVVPDASWRNVVQDTVSLFMDFNDNRDAIRRLAGADPQERVDQFVDEHETDRDALFDEVWEALQVPADARILEVAAGDLRTARRLHDKGHRLVCIEAVPEILGRGVYDTGVSIPRLCGSAARLPFRDASFDVVFCQAALHHLDDMAPVLRECARVLVTGGLFLAAAEPYRAVGSKTWRIRQHLPDESFNMGLNEQLPLFRDYATAMERAGLSELRAHTRAQDMRPPGRLGALGGGLVRLGRSPRSGGWRMLVRHALTHGQTSIAATRTESTIPPPPALTPPHYLFKPEDYIVHRHRRSLVGIWKALSPVDSLPRMVEVDPKEDPVLRRGFLPPAPGEDFCWMIAVGAVLLRVEPGDTRLACLARNPPGGATVARIEASMDGEALGRINLPAGEDWSELSWTLPSNGDAGAADFRLACEQLRPLAGGRHGSIQVRRIRLQ